MQKVTVATLLMSKLNVKAKNKVYRLQSIYLTDLEGL